MAWLSWNIGLTSKTLRKGGFKGFLTCPDMPSCSGMLNYTQVGRGVLLNAMQMCICVHGNAPCAFMIMASRISSLHKF